MRYLPAVPEYVIKHGLSMIVVPEHRPLAERLLTDARMVVVWEKLKRYDPLIALSIFVSAVGHFYDPLIPKAQARHAREHYDHLAGIAAELQAGLVDLLRPRGGLFTGFLELGDGHEINVNDLARLGEIRAVLSRLADINERVCQTVACVTKFNGQTARRTAYMKRLSSEVRRLLGRPYDSLVADITNVVFDAQMISESHVRVARSSTVRLFEKTAKNHTRQRKI
jgi:hypothetical protein